MNFRAHRFNSVLVSLHAFLIVLALLLPLGHGSFAASAPAKSESLDDLYEKAKKEGGKLTLYMAISQRSADIIFPLFKKRFPAITIDHIDATGDKLIARLLTEARGGRVLGDVFGGALPYIAQMSDQKMLETVNIPEAAPFPAALKSDFWVATDTQYFIAGWNTNLIKKDEPKSFEDLAHSRFKGMLMGEPRDYQLLVGMAKRKYNSDEKAVDLMKKIAANQPEFHRGHSQLAEFLVAGQRAVCFTCYSHHFPPRVKKGAPIQAVLSEGVGEIGGAVSVIKGAPHPNSALLWARWAISEEGQKAYAQAGETPAHPNVSPKENVRPTNTFMLSIDDVKEFPKYEKMWKDAFQIR